VILWDMKFTTLHSRACYSILNCKRTLAQYNKSKVKLSLCLIKHHAMKMYWGVEVYLCTFLTLHTMENSQKYSVIIMYFMFVIGFLCSLPVLFICYLCSVFRVFYKKEVQNKKYLLSIHSETMLDKALYQCYSMNTGLKTWMFNIKFIEIKDKVFPYFSICKQGKVSNLRAKKISP
jgi:hypothetical protein